MTGQPATFGRPYPRQVAWRQGLLTKVHTLVYRLSVGLLGASLLGMPMLLLTTWGRRSGKLRTTPLLYLPVDGVFVLVASNGGALHHPTWWFNLQAHPEALVQIGPVRGRVRALPASLAERRRFWPRSRGTSSRIHRRAMTRDRRSSRRSASPRTSGTARAQSWTRTVAGRTSIFSRCPSRK
jgi:deazaflavin-dependent oxidoreductase (nitroreductase family)